QRGGTPPAAMLSLLLAVASIAAWLLPQRRITAAVGAALVLAMAGLLMQLELGLATQDLSALRHYHKTAALLAVGSALATLWRLGRRARPVPQRSAEWVLAGLTAVALAALAAQALWGDETGVFDMQPVELAKIALAALSAHGLALHLGGQRGQHWRWLRLAAPALLFCALLAMALVYVDDYSPLILLSVWAGCSALAYAAAARRLVLAAALAAVACALAAAVWALHNGGAEGLQRLPQSFYADRFQVWLAPGDHPHTGQQWLQGARAIAAGGWSGADHLFGLRTAGQPDSMAAAIPAVQDDFAPSFFLYRHGLLGALLLWCVQAAMLAGLLQQAMACHQRAAAAQGYGSAWRERLRCFLLCGGAAFLFGHFLLSWGTNLAIFPVMGQPMSFMSAGGSHLLFFLCPLLTVSMDALPPS
ncbi:FtsW/RodA/SpoVE family cell cycle protein, partial [Pseudoduganella ginsengisoli]